MNEAIKLPIWKYCLERMRESGFTYGSTWEGAFFEKELRASLDSNEFAFEMLALREAMEKEDGYYLRSEDNGKRWYIPQAADHEGVCQRIERGLRRDAVRVINLRAATLMNPQAELESQDRARMEKNMEIAATRLVLISRQKTVVRALGDKASTVLRPSRSLANHHEPTA